MRHYFDIASPSRVRDRVGMNLQNVGQVRHEALRRAAEFASDIENLETSGAVVVTARDEAGVIAMTVRLVCSVEVSARAADETV